MLQSLKLESLPFRQIFLLKPRRLVMRSHFRLHCLHSPHSRLHYVQLLAHRYGQLPFLSTPPGPTHYGVHPGVGTNWSHGPWVDNRARFSSRSRYFPSSSLLLVFRLLPAWSFIGVSQLQTLRMLSVTNIRLSSATHPPRLPGYGPSYGFHWSGDT
jgi:hypothetical protein